MLQILKVWRKIVRADMDNVSNGRKLQLFSCYGMKWLLVQQWFRRFSHKQKNHLLIIILQRFISKMPVALSQHALELVSTAQCAIAMIHLKRAIGYSHLPHIKNI